MMNRLSHLIAFAPLAASAIGCTAPPAYRVVPEAPADPAAMPAVDQAGGDVCTIVRRGGGHGTVRDARIAEHWPNKNYGRASSGFAGNVNGGARQTLLAFDLPAIPEGATITSAKLRLHKCVCGGSGVTAHRVTTSWTESDVTWNSFGAGYEQSPFAEVPRGTDERTSLDITALARAWADGSAANHGILLRQDDANTAISTSEAAEADERPTLEVCWTTGG